MLNYRYVNFQEKENIFSIKTVIYLTEKQNLIFHSQLHIFKKWQTLGHETTHLYWKKPIEHEIYILWKVLEIDYFGDKLDYVWSSSCT